MYNNQSKLGKTITITRGRQAMAREDFVVRGYGKRAVRVVLMVNYNTLEPISKKLSELELSNLLAAIAAKISKLGWKNGVVIMTVSQITMNSQVHLKNPAGRLIHLGQLGSLVE